MQGRIRSFASDESGAVAGIYAVALIGLIAIGGVGFDYARMAGMDSELQNAADQAALAAATQLDGQNEACSRADEAAIGLLTNVTLLSNDGSGNLVTVNASGSAATGSDQCGNRGYIQFYQTYVSGQQPSSNVTASSDETAKVVLVEVDSRTARYAFTPIVGAIFSTMSARAVASLGSSVCNTPPVMICNPAESTDPNFDGLYKGKGVRLVSVGGGGGGWVPGNFGYLRTGNGNGANALRAALGWNTPPGECIETTGVDTKPGANTSVTDAINTRFDIYDQGQNCPSGGVCSPSVNAVKDLIKKNGTTGNACSLGSQGWDLAPEADQYLPASVTPLTSGSTMPKVMGYPRDICHAVADSTGGHCTSPVGTGTWDRNAYFKVNYPSWGWGTWPANTGLPSDATRYEVYRWEMDNVGNSVVGETVLDSRYVTGNGNNARYSHGAAQCATPVTPGGLVADRRKITVAVINCVAEGVNGSSTNVPVTKWIDAFLVEPSVNRPRTHQGDVYIEIVDVTKLGGGGEVGQAVRKDKPYLIE
jgi:Flp pilus assembly protein TadG